MEKKLKGAWLVHHTNKLQSVTNQRGYEKTFLAGKAGILLSAISADNQSTVSKRRLEALAQAANINCTFELPRLLDVLTDRKLIDPAGGGVAVLGVTTASTLQHTSDIFDSLKPLSQEEAAIELAEAASIRPVRASEISEKLEDEYYLGTQDVKQLLQDAEEIGFVDVEPLGKSGSLLFNGNLFRRETMSKITAVLDSLSTDDQQRLNEITEQLRTRACIPLDEAKEKLGHTLFEKISAIGLFDISVVSNSQEETGYLTLPSAFSKYSSSIVDDAFDSAKALVSSITYGMTKSGLARGRITMVNALLSALVRGESVGPVPAIKEDYKILELKGVVSVSTGTKKGRTGPMMTLLKKEVGELARQAINQGDVSEHSLTALPSAAVTQFRGPEQNRERIRRTQSKTSPKATQDMLSVLREGGGF